MGNNESVVCGKKNPKKSSTAENNEEQQLEDANDEEQMEDIDDGVLIANNKDNYFTKEDYELLAKKFPDDKGWMSPSMTMSKSKTKAKRIKWKEGDIIGNGSFGRVIMGLNLQTGSIMAVKQVQIGATNTQAQQERIKALEQEIEMLSQLSHKNIVSYFGSHKTKTTFNIFLEYISGGTIASLIEKYGPLNENLIRVYTRQILEGLEYLHARNTIHRDIKGANVLVDNTGVCKLADFGTAKRISSIVEGETRYMPSIRGTVNWMAPEVIKQTTLGRYSDIWSVGCTVLEMATGKIPWSHLMKPNATQISALYQIATAKSHPPIPEGLSPEATDFLKQCFKINPVERSNVIELLNHRFLVPGDVIERPIPETKNNTKHKKSDSGNQKTLPKQPDTKNTTNQNQAYAKYKTDSITNIKEEHEEKPQPLPPKENKPIGHHRKSTRSREFQDFKQIIPAEDLERSILVTQNELPQQQQKPNPPEDFHKINLPTLGDNSVLNLDSKADTYADILGEIRAKERNFSTPAPLIINHEIPFVHSNSEQYNGHSRHHKVGSPLERIESQNSPTVNDATKNEQSISEIDLKRIDPARLAKRKSRIRPLGKTDHLNGSRLALFSQNEEELSMNCSTLENVSRKSSDHMHGEIPQRQHVDIPQRHKERKKSQFGGQNREIDFPEDPNLDPEEAKMSRERAIFYSRFDSSRSPGITTKTSQTISNPDSDVDSNVQHFQQSNSGSIVDNMAGGPKINIITSNNFPPGYHKKSASLKNIPARGMSRVIQEVQMDHETYSDSTADPFGQGLSALKTSDKLSQFGREKDLLEVTPVRKLTGTDLISETKEKFFAKKGRPFRSARQIGGVKSGILIDYNTPRKEDSAEASTNREHHGDYFIRLGNEAKNEEKIIIGSPYQNHRESESPLEIKEQHSAKEETPTNRNGWLEGTWNTLQVEGEGLNLNPEHDEMKATYHKKQYVS